MNSLIQILLIAYLSGLIVGLCSLAYHLWKGKEF